MCEFQSAPLTKARGDDLEMANAQLTPVFQSAPLTKARGDRINPQAPISPYDVSIRSPHKSKGRHWLL